MTRYTAADPYTFVHIAGDGYRISHLSPGDSHYCGLTGAGQIHCWGDNQWGQLGDGTDARRTGPVLVTGGHTWATP